MAVSTTETVTSVELIAATGITERRFYYWTHAGVISPVGESRPGSGGRHQWDACLIPKLKLAVMINEVFAINDVYFLKRIIDNYEKGELDFIDFKLTWTPKEQK